MKWLGQYIQDLPSRFRDTVDFSEDVTFYQPVNDANPNISLGSSDDERLRVLVNYQGTTTQVAQSISFKTYTEGSAANDGKMQFVPDEVHVLTIDDGGIDFEANFGISINGVDILTNAGTGATTLSNINTLDATTISTLNTALTAGDITGVIAGTNLNGGGTGGTVTINLADAGATDKGAASFSSDNFAASSGAITIKDEGVDLTTEVAGVLPSSNMDGDTAHLTTDQTFTGNKTFDEEIQGSISGSAATVTSIGNLTGDVTSSNRTTTLAAAQPNIESIGTDGDSLQIIGDTLLMQNTTASKPNVYLQNLANDATGPVISLRNRRYNSGWVDAQDGDVLGTLEFSGVDDGTPSAQDYAKIYADIADATSGQEAGRLTFQVAEFDGAVTTGLMLDGDTDANGEIDVTIGAGAASVTTIAGTLTMGSTASMTNAGLVAVANQSNITGVGTIGTGVWNGTKITDIYTNSSGKRYGSTIKILPSDFIANDEGSIGVAFDDDANTGMVLEDTDSEMWAFVSIPEGMTATAVNIFSNNTSRDFYVYEMDINANGIGSSLGNDKLNTAVTIDVDSTATNFLAIKLDLSATNQRIRGGLVTIAPQ